MKIDIYSHELEKDAKAFFVNRFKRSDIDSRLIELQAKIDFINWFNNMPAGHGKFDFNKM